VNRLSSKGEYAASIAAVPQDVYPDKRTLAGIGDEAVLFTGGGVRYLVAPRGDAGVVIFPHVGERELSDSQLSTLAERALSKQ
jgi:hypothetical protein